MGRTAQQAGKQFEMMIEQANQVYKLQGKALIMKAEPTVKTFGKGKEGFSKSVYAKSNGLDYFGSLKGGQGVFFEAKQTAETSFPLKQIKAHQVELFRAYEKLDTLAFLLVRFSKTGKMYLLPPKPLIEAYDGWTKYSNRASIPLATFEACGTEITASQGCAVDWMDAIQNRI